MFVKDPIISLLKTIKNLLITAIFTLIICTIILYNKQSNTTVTTQTSQVDTLVYKQDFYNKSPKDGLYEALLYYNIHHPEIVYSQAILETGYFKSPLCINHNNLFGLYNSNTKQYYKFNHWSESIKAYSDFIQYKYNKEEDYYSFLERINYAEDPEYIIKLKYIVDNL